VSLVIDSHHHLWQYDREEFGWISDEMEVLQRDFFADELSREMWVAGVSGAIAVQARSSLEETGWLLDCTEGGVVGWVPLEDPDVRAVLRGFGGRLKGVRHIVQAEPDGFLRGEAFGQGIRALTDAGLVYDVLVVERQMAEAVEFVRRHPEQRFVLDHLGKPRIAAGEIDGWREQMMRLADSGNVACKLSGLVTEANWATWTLEDLRPYLDVALAAFGAERLMAGSDWPVCLVASSYARWWSALREWAEPLSQVERDAILGGTAISVYQL
jgi:L-fuconolactonase